MLVWCHRYEHHAREGEVQKSEEHEEQIPEKFVDSPLKTNHGISYNAKNYSFCKNIWQLNRNLQGKVKIEQIKTLKLRENDVCT